MNKVILIGNLTKDPELIKTPNDVSICKFNIAVDRGYADNEGNRETDFFNITVWRGRADTCAKFLKKGNKVSIVGKLQNHSYEDKDGIKRNVTDIIADEVEFLTPKAHEDVSVSSITRVRPELESIDDNQLPF